MKMAAVMVWEEVVHGDRELLATDFAPSSAHAHAFKVWLYAQEKAIQDMGFKISHLERQLEELRAHQHALLYASAVRSALLAPVRRLPPETLGEIFLSCIPDPDGVAENITPYHAPLVLLHICRRWRRVALGTPRLWTRITLQRKLKVNPFIILPMYLRHSGSLPIDFNITPERWHRPQAPHEPLRGVEKLIKSISENMDRCRIFCGSGTAYLEALFPLGRRTNATLLHEFRINKPDISDYPSEQLKLGVVSAPNVKKIDIADPWLSLHLIAFQRHVLRSFRSGISSQTLEALHQLLELCPNLEEWEVVHPFLAENMHWRPRSITLPSLRSMTLTWSDDVDPSQFLASLQVPGLTELRLEYIDVPALPGLAPALKSLLSGPSPPLKELNISGLKLSQSDIIFLLRKLFFLETLAIQRGRVTARVLEALTPDAAQPLRSWLCPRLSSVILDCSRVPGLQLTRTIEGRAVRCEQLGMDPGNRQLKSVTLHFCRGLSRGDVKALHELEQTREGLSFEGLDESMFEYDLV